MDLHESNASRLGFEAHIEGLVSVIGHADRIVPLHDYCTGLVLPGEQSRSKSRGGPIRLASIAVVSPLSTADSSIPVSVNRAPDRNSRSSSPVCLSAPSLPRVASTVWRGLPLTRWLSTIWRYSQPPDRLVRKYTLARWLPARF